MPLLSPPRDKIAELIPTSAPLLSTSAPPEFPGFIEASVWIKFSYWLSPILSLFNPETIPWVTLSPTPKGLPMANTTSPSSSLELSAKLIAANPFASILITARSVFGSLPMILALYSLPPFASVTKIWSLSSITWLLVTIYPSVETMTPDPSDVLFSFSLGMPKLKPKNSLKKGSLNISLTPAFWFSVLVVEILTTDFLASLIEPWYESIAFWLPSSGETREISGFASLKFTSAANSE